MTTSNGDEVAPAEGTDQQPQRQRSLAKELAKLHRRIDALEQRLDMLDREVRMMSLDTGDSDALRSLVFKEEAPSQDQSLMDLVTSGPPADPLQEMELDESEGLVQHLTERIESARKTQSDIYDFLMRILLKQEIQNSRMKLLFLSQTQKDIDYMLFDELDLMESYSSNPLVKKEELLLRWQIFEEKVKREVQRLGAE